MPAIPIPPARCRRCMSRSSSSPRPKPRITTTASSIAISPGVRRRRTATMAPDADAGKSLRADPFAPLTSEWRAVGDGHEIYVETVGRAGGIPAVYLHGGPGSGCQPDHRRLDDPERFHAVLFDQRGAGRSRPKGSREHNTLSHLISDMEIIREKFAIPRWMVVGGSWGATLALAYAQAHPDRVTGIVLRATFLGTRAELEGAFLDALPPAPGTTPSGSFPNTRPDISGSILIRSIRRAPCPPRRSWKRITSRTTVLCDRVNSWRTRKSLIEFPA